MIPPQFSYSRYAVVSGVSACGLVVALILREMVGQYVILPSVAAVAVSAWFYGMKGGVVATILGLLSAAYFFGSASGAIIRIVTFIGVAALITNLMHALRASKIRLTATLSSIGDAVVVTDRKGAICFLNPVAEALLGYGMKEAFNRPLSELIRLENEKTGERVESPLAKVLAEGAAIHSTVHSQLISKDGHRVSVEESVSPICDERGNVKGAILIFRDTTKRRQVQDQLSQSQKMEAVGRLAGGVAGDFNNLLTVITGYSEMLRSDLPAGNPLRRFADEILYAAERAAALTRQLLAFSRSQFAQAKVLDLNALITSMEVMLKRLLGSSIELVLLLDQLVDHGLEAFGHDRPPSRD